LLGCAPNSAQASRRQRFIPFRLLRASHHETRRAQSSTARQKGLALLLPDLEAHAMKPDRRRNRFRGELHSVRSLRRSNTLTATVAQTAASVFTEAAPWRTGGQSSLAQARSNGEPRRTLVHVDIPRCAPGRSSGAIAHLAPFQRSAQRCGAAGEALYEGDTQHKPRARGACQW
jgi:hypothetical protein